MYMQNAKLALVVAAVCVIGLITGSVATAGVSPPTTSPCTYGDAMQTFEAPFTGNLIDSECQYRLYRDGETFIFCEGDYILGGIVFFWEYKLLGIPREEAIADIELNEDRVWIDGVEMPLMHTVFKNGGVRRRETWSLPHVGHQPAAGRRARELLGELPSPLRPEYHHNPSRGASRHRPGV
jgi:hypothetical protein